MSDLSRFRDHCAEMATATHTPECVDRLSHWLERTRKAKAQIVAMYDERFFRMWEFYLAGGVVAFESGTMCNYQMQYARDRRALPITRDYMAEAEARYREAR